MISMWNKGLKRREMPTTSIYEATNIYDEYIG